MPDSPTLKSPITKVYAAADAGAALTLADETDKAKMIVRTPDGTAARSSLSVDFASSKTIDGVLVAGSRPDEWMLIGDAAAVASMVDELPVDGHVSTIDWTHGRAIFRLTGESAPSALEKVCGLDLSESMTPDGAVTSGSVASVTCDMIRNDVSGIRSYMILVDRSFGQYLFDALLDAGDEFGIGVAG
ncbi:MAG: sarcosine oxidase subunit gamma [Acidimicrobiales bacterium]